MENNYTKFEIVEWGDINHMETEVNRTADQRGAGPIECEWLMQSTRPRKDQPRISAVEIEKDGRIEHPPGTE